MKANPIAARGGKDRIRQLATIQRPGCYERAAHATDNSPGLVLFVQVLGNQCHQLPSTCARAMRERMIAAGLTKAESIDRLLEGVESAVNGPERVQITFTLVQAWGAKPSK